MTTGVDCRVYAAGVRVPDGTVGDDPSAPTALSGLSVTWGRSTTVDQPEPATCEFDVMDIPGGATFMDMFRTGIPVDVISRGAEVGGDGRPAMADPSFEAGAPGAAIAHVGTNATVTYQTGGATGAQAAQIIPVDAASPARVGFPPAPFSENVAGWDEIPQPEAGATWTIGATVHAPAGSIIAVGPVLFDDPTGRAVTFPDVGGTSDTASGDWQEFVFSYTADKDGFWLGVAVTVDAFPHWESMPGDWVGTPGRWVDYGVAAADDLVVLTPSGGTSRTVSVFSGRVTDLAASFDDSLGCPLVHVTAQDFTADLENIDIGDEPWPAETMESRFLRIVTESGLPITSIIDDSISDILVSYQDVDAQGAAGLLRDLAQSVDGVLWPAVHQTTGAYLRVEDPANRAALFVLTMGDDGMVHIIPAGREADAVTISACDVLRDPVEWHQSVSDVSTRVAVEWLEQGVDDDGLPTTNSHTETLVDDELEVDHGKRRISVSTLLQSAADARTVATRILARTESTGWRVSGFTIDDDDSLEDKGDETIRLLLTLLDGTARIGLPIRLVDMPSWSPVSPSVGVYLEGGTYHYIDGSWTLALIVSSALAVGESVPWADMPADWAWSEFDESISWNDLVGVTAPPSVEEKRNIR